MCQRSVKRSKIISGKVRLKLSYAPNHFFPNFFSTHSFFCFLNLFPFVEFDFFFTTIMIFTLEKKKSRVFLNESVDAKKNNTGILSRNKLLWNEGNKKIQKLTFLVVITTVSIVVHCTLPPSTLLIVNTLLYWNSFDFFIWIYNSHLTWCWREGEEREKRGRREERERERERERVEEKKNREESF